MKRFILTSLMTMIVTTTQAIIYLEVDRPSHRNYSISSEMCCNGTIYENKNSSDYECCAEKLIDKKNEICCFPSSYPRQANTQCCRNTTFDNSTHQCIILSKSHHTRNFTKDKVKEIILPLSISRFQSCGDKIFNITEEICCDYQIIPDPEHKLTCCGDDGGSYNPSSHVCCDKKIGSFVIPKSKTTDDSCCNGESYNKAVKICHNDVLIPRQSDEIELCISGELFNKTKQICCSRDDFKPKVIPKSKPDHILCCGNESYYYSDDENWMCCSSYNDSKIYSKSEAVAKQCCGTEIIDKSLECCGYQLPYDPSTQICCQVWNQNDKKIIAKVYNGLDVKCCGAEIMNSEKEDCCGVTVVPKSPNGEIGCCLQIIHDLNDEPIRVLQNHRYHF